MKKLEELRVNNNLTQEELATKLNVSRQSVSEWERGRGYPSIDKLIELSKILQTSIDYLLTGNESEYRHINDSDLPFITLSKKDNLYDGLYLGKLNNKYAYLSSSEKIGTTLTCGASGTGKSIYVAIPNIKTALKRNEKCIYINDNIDFLNNIDIKLPEKTLKLNQDNFKLNVFKDLKINGKFKDDYIKILYDVFLSGPVIFPNKTNENDFAFSKMEYELFSYLIKNGCKFSDIKKLKQIPGISFNDRDVICDNDIISNMYGTNTMRDILFSIKFKLNFDFDIVENGDISINDLLNYDFISIGFNNYDIEYKNIRSIQYLVAMLLKKIEKREIINTEKINLFLDNFGTYFHDFNIYNQINITRDFVNTFIFVQNLVQLSGDYTHFLDVDNIIYLGSMETNTLSKLSKKFGITIDDLIKIDTNELYFKRFNRDLIKINKK
jgi:transcriptional regulator with XRE-family HTH domain